MKNYKLYGIAFSIMLLFVSGKAQSDADTIAEPKKSEFLENVTPTLESQQRILRENELTNQYNCAEQEAQLSYQEAAK